MMVIGTLGSMGAGATLPLMMFFFTSIIDNYTVASLVNCPSNCPNVTKPGMKITNETVAYNLFGEVRNNAINLCSKMNSI